MSRRPADGPFNAAGGLLASALVLLIVFGSLVGLLGLVGWSWSGFVPDVALVLVAALAFLAIGAIGLVQTFKGRRPWWLFAIAAAVFVLVWVAVW